MIFRNALKFPSAIGTILLMALIAPSAVAAQSQVKSIAADIPIEQRTEALRNVSEQSCPESFEHAMPGVYYYCVGIRDIARGDNDRARSMLEIAASWGSKPAQFTLGVGYYKGDVQPLDRGRGLAWLGLAAERKNPGYSAIFKSAWDHATPQERVRGDTLWKELLPEYGDKRAGRRAELRYRGERDRMMANSIGARICMGMGNTGRHGGTRQSPADPSKARGASEVQCVTQPVAVIVKKMDGYADTLLSGWNGHVTVGPLQQVSAPSK